VAGSLVRQGIPAVVAMQFEISDRAACAFAEEFYAALAQGYPVDAGLAEARKAIYCLPEDVEWGTPVLYLRAPDGVLFDVVDKPGPKLRASEVTSDQSPVISGLEKAAAQPARQKEPAAPEAVKPVRQPEVQTKPDPKQSVPAVQAKVTDLLAELATFIHIPERKFWIGKYPVTNAQYRRFLEAPDFAEGELWLGFQKIGEPPGYQQLVDWGEEGWKWLQSQLGKNKVVYPRAWQYAEWGIIQEKSPVVRITWYEANAYCKWLSKHWAELAEGQQNPRLQPARLRLPTEAEWVFAAGGDQPDGRYPWDTPGKATTDVAEIVRRANVEPSKIGRTKAVDAYPEGASQPYGLHDLAGNVWEWQANYYNKDRNYLALRALVVLSSWLRPRGRSLRRSPGRRLVRQRVPGAGPPQLSFCGSVCCFLRSVFPPLTPQPPLPERERGACAPSHGCTGGRR
jgi:formylglycine-generating enzyme required for sulfatase activity